MGDFNNAFNLSLDTAEQTFGEGWSLNGTDFHAINIEELDATERAALGGNLQSANLTIELSRLTVAISGIKRGSRIVARGKSLEVFELKDDGTNAVTYFCKSTATAARL